MIKKKKVKKNTICKTSKIKETAKVIDNLMNHNNLNAIERFITALASLKLVIAHIKVCAADPFHLKIKKSGDDIFLKAIEILEKGLDDFDSHISDAAKKVKENEQ
jgi:hypothetical protein